MSLVDGTGDGSDDVVSDNLLSSLTSSYDTVEVGNVNAARIAAGLPTLSAGEAAQLTGGAIPPAPAESAIVQYLPWAIAAIALVFLVKATQE